MHDPEIPDLDMVQARSIWLTGQTCSREQRRGRYTPESMAHPGKMIPAIARYLIHTFTDPGDVVLDPMAGIGTTVVEAMHADRYGVGVEYEHRWAQLAAANLARAVRHGATGRGEVYCGDSRRLPELLPERHAGRVKLVITSPPYGDSTHGHVRTPGTHTGRVRKIHHRYGDDATNLAYRDHAELADGFADILTGCRTVLHPDGTIAVTARPYRRHGDLIDIPAMVIAAGKAAGLELIDRCYPLIAGVRDGRVIARGSFFQLHNIRTAQADGDPQWLVSAEDLIVFAPPRTAPALDVSTCPHMDRRLEPAHSATPNNCGDAASRGIHRVRRSSERTANPCPTGQRPVPGSDPTNTDDGRTTHHHVSHSPQTRSSSSAGTR